MKICLKSAQHNLKIDFVFTVQLLLTFEDHGLFKLSTTMSYYFEMKSQ
jgi:hypothetical protein